MRFNFILTVFTTGDVSGVDSDNLRELERKLEQAERELREADLDTRLGELRLAQTGQAKQIGDFEAELELLRREVLNIADIRFSLPEGCFRRTRLEP